jgi:bifunctional DNase/RNase
MQKIELEISGLSYSQTQSGAYALVLIEKGGKRQLPIIIGGFEAQAIAIELEKMTPTRPLTHDLFKHFAMALGVKVTEVMIYNLNEGIFFAKLICVDKEGQIIEIDARTSDAIAIGIRFKAPIFTFENILASAGVLLDENDLNEEAINELQNPESTNNSELTMEELQEQLNQALANEDYEEASRIRDEIKKRTS